MTPFLQISLGFIYLLAAWAALRIPFRTLRGLGFALVNLAGVYVFFCRWNEWSSPYPWRGGALPYSLFFLVYVGVVVIQYIALYLFSRRADWRAWLAVLIPVVFLIGVKYASRPFSQRVCRWMHFPDGQVTTLMPFFVGISYLAFRASYLVLEVRNGMAELPTLPEYLGYCFFLPTMSVGPISPYGSFSRAYTSPMPLSRIGLGPAFRVLIGAVKYFVFSNLLVQLTFKPWFEDGHIHGHLDLAIATAAYYLYLYCNFSGFCDIAIGVAGLMGVRIHENFDGPLLSRNIKDFWNRWHITLSTYMRDMVFSPLSKWLVAIFGPKSVNHCIAVSIFVVFLLIGIWHGTGKNFAVFGLIQATGMVIHHYYTLGLKKALGKERFRAYNQSLVIRWIATGVTFWFVAGSLLFFAYPIPVLLGYVKSVR